MTIYIIEPSNPLPPTYGDGDHALDLREGDAVILSYGATIEAHGFRASGIWGTINTTLQIDGRVFSRLERAIATHGDINIGASGEISGFDAGIWLMQDYRDGSTNTLNNSGRIYGYLSGITLFGTNSFINNSGQIVGAIGIYATSSDALDEKLVINNTGLIKSSEEDHAIIGVLHGPNIITNRGHIEGQVLLGHFNDFYDGRGGTVNGDVYLGHGDDIAYGGEGSETFGMGIGTNFVDAGGGIDTVFFNQPAIVDLRLLGRQQINFDTWNTIRNVENLLGSSWDDRLTGNDVANGLHGAAGNDTLEGNGGNDTLTGSFGDDVLSGGAGTDVAVFVSRTSDYTITVGEDGAVTIRDNRGGTGSGTDRLTEIEFAQFDDRIVDLSTLTRGSGGEVGNPVPQVPLVAPTPLQTAAAPLTLKGGKKADVLVGGAGNDLLNGGLGNDRLSGGEGSDVFAFSTKLKKNVDRLLDFSGADDTIQLSKAVFGKLQKGVLSKDAFRIGAKAADADDRIIYNAKTGALSYDADGSGTAHAAVTFAKVKAGTHLTADDFLVI